VENGILSRYEHCPNLFTLLRKPYHSGDGARSEGLRLNEPLPGHLALTPVNSPTRIAPDNTE
jgi:hypothetical protein